MSHKKIRFLVLTFITGIMASLPACFVNVPSKETEPSKDNHGQIYTSPVKIQTITATEQPTQAIPASPMATLEIATFQSTAVPISDEDPFLAELRTKNYTILRAGSLIGSDGYIYSAYLHIEPNPDAPYARSDSRLETWIIAFYVWDGRKNTLVASFFGNSYSKSDESYPQAYYLMNWDIHPDPYINLALEYHFEPDDFPRETLKLNGFASDINHNGLPEFAFVGKYCPVSCTHPEIKFDFFEIQNPQTVVDLAADLPDHLSPYPYDTDPMTFPVCISRGYEFYSQIRICKLYAWKDDKFTDVTELHIENYVEQADKELQKLKVKYGQPFNSPYDLHALNIVFLYEAAGMREKASRTFLEITEFTHWPATTPLFACWLQIGRATIQEDFKNNRLFSMPPSPTDIDFGVKRYLDLFDSNKYDFSECWGLRP